MDRFFHGPFFCLEQLANRIDWGIALMYRNHRRTHPYMYYEGLGKYELRGRLYSSKETTPSNQMLNQELLLSCFS